MTQRREIDARLALYDDLSGILGAMRSFALAELHRIARREEAQQQVVQALLHPLHAVSPFLPPQAACGSNAWLLFGSTRGFCGSFNEDILHAWQAADGIARPTIVVGDRLAATMPENIRLISVQGAEGGLDAAPAIDRILEAVKRLRSMAGESCGLVACLHDEEKVRIQRLLPLPAPRNDQHLPPLMNEPAPKVAAGVAEHFLFHTLLSMLLRSIKMENRMRLMQMENALRHLENGSEDLKRQLNRLRQEEIVEEIELMVRERTSMY